jgi:hypothetical protein
MLRRSAGYLAVLLAVASAVPAMLIALLCASGATTGTRGHFDVAHLGVELTAVVALSIGSWRLLARR